MLSFKNFFIGGGTNKQWQTLSHNGPLFPKKYVPHNVPVIINNKQIILPELAEEYASMFAKYLGTKYMEMSKFKKNFWKDFKPTLINIDVKSLEDIDFTLIKNYLDKEHEKKLALSKEEKLLICEKQKKEEELYMYCIIDGEKQKVGNYKIEPPGIFLGRGTHPKIGHIKKRVNHEDITLNLDKVSKIPEPPKGHKWGDIIHDQSVIWLATWKENITNKNKYIFTAFESFFKSKSDEEKFELAKKLKKKINNIRETYENALTNDNMKTRQLATALYFIDNLALRVGGKKDSKEEADTVGVSSLRVEHITLLDDNTIKLDFLGKDSIRYCKKINVHTNVYENLKLFTKDKSHKEDLFDLINANQLNEYLNSFMKGLTSKVWRTYNASNTFQKELDKLTNNKKLDIFDNKEEKINYLISLYNQANTSVAILCNHQKAVSTNSDKVIDKIDQKLKEYKKKKKLYKEKKKHDKVTEINKKIELLKSKKESKQNAKNVSLQTSKQNYIDPRITFAFSKKYDIPPEKLFTQKLISIFQWASIVDETYRF